jgi:hypothetical protein
MLAQKIGVLRALGREGKGQCGAKRSCARRSIQWLKGWESRSELDGTHSGVCSQHYFGLLARTSKSSRTS